MEWKLIQIDQKQSPMVTVEPGRFVFNAAAGELVHDDGSYCYAQFFSARESWRTVMAVKFLTEPQDNCLPLMRLSRTEDFPGEIVVQDSGIISAQFLKEKQHERDVSLRFAVERIDESMLKIAD